MSAPRLAFLAQLASTLPLVGLIWLIQIVSYPLFARVGAEAFARYHAGHTTLITLVVAPLMLVELAACVATLALDDSSYPRSFAWAGAALVALAWAVTLFASVPAHNLLAHGFDPDAHTRLVATNWLRTAAWTTRGALLLVHAARVL
jgi:hypothetical protein